ncbi:MAG: DsbC family protein [Burkholderiales bacterium]|nr:DsbC family protein [Burkholderiales bacterium]
MFRIFTICLLTAAVVFSPAAGANENAIRQAFQSKFAEMPVESVAKSPIAGIWEVVAQGQIFYVDEKVNYVLRGVLFDSKTPELRNLTAEREAQLATQTLAKSQDLAIKRVKGSGKRILYTFEDPNCGYCKKLQEELVKLNNVTIYTFLLPIVSPPDSVEKSKAVWCAKDRGKAWDDLLSKGVVPGGSKTCDTPIEKTVQLAQRFGVRGTPAIYLANGQQIGGYLPLDKIEQALNSVK